MYFFTYRASKINYLLAFSEERDDIVASIMQTLDNSTRVLIHPEQEERTLVKKHADCVE